MIACDCVQEKGRWQRYQHERISSSYTSQTGSRWGPTYLVGHPTGIANLDRPRDLLVGDALRDHVVATVGLPSTQIQGVSGVVCLHIAGV
jgi:hypothetical protein